MIIYVNPFVIFYIFMGVKKPPSTLLKIGLGC
nr:MAG TPA: hypothetical protein [Bacteriophage sp.]